MGLFNLYRKNYPQNFNEYESSLSEKGRQALLVELSQYGEPNKILTDLLKTSPCCLNKELDVRVTGDFLLKFNIKKTNFYLYKLDMFQYCYHSQGGMCSSYDYVGLIRKDGIEIVLLVKKSKCKESFSLFYALQQHICGFEQLSHRVVSEDDGLMRLLRHYFKDAQNVIWCEQHYDNDADANDCYWLKLYGSNKKTTMHFNSNLEAFQEAIKLKQRIPHLLYGPSEEYEGIYKTDPARLMSLAKSKMNK